MELKTETYQKLKNRFAAQREILLWSTVEGWTPIAEAKKKADQINARERRAREAFQVYFDRIFGFSRDQEGKFVVPLKVTA